ncbi:MAG: hypothetical protein Q3M24_16480 [Candidatus Electrothrix aestuarii]|uniref:Replication initiation factor n=1 Tax=Candidatus Electrothrix aestuarii TaxID=3062594 RepID=A0AAU8LRW7_9BACT|nr:hypothetical protein [Candidatus Electrothrix aestuarii]
MQPQKLTRKFKGEPFQYHARCEKREDAIDERNALIAEGHKARFAKDPVYGVYHVYVRVEDSPEAQADAAHEAFDPSFRPGVPSLSPGSPGLQYMAGLDKLKISLHLNGQEELLALGRDMKDQMQDPEFNKNPNAKEVSLEFIGGERFNVRAVGIPKYPVVFENADIVIALSSHKVDAQQPNCRIEIGSVSCWKPGWLYLTNVIFGMLRRYGCEIVRQKVTQCDVCVDLLDVDFRETGFGQEERWKARSNDYGVKGRHFKRNYINFGKGDIFFKAYDKSRELDPLDSKYTFFHQLWKDHLGHDVDHVTRLEFQLRRPVIKKLKIKSVYDLSRKLNSLWAYLVGDGKENKGWAKFLDREMTESDRKNKNHQRYEVDALWEAVQKVRFKKGRTFRLSREKVQHLDIVRLKKMMAGCGSSLCGGLGLAEEDCEGHIKFACSMLEEQMRENYRKDAREYRRKISTKYNKAELTF